MALTKTGTDGIKDDAITLDKLAHGTSSQDGKFLRANNGSAPTFETVSVDLSSTFDKGGGDTITGDFTIASGTTNKNINVDVSDKVRFDDNLKATFGNGDDLKIYHDSGGNSYIEESGSGSLVVKAADHYFQNADGTKTFIQIQSDQVNINDRLDVIHNGGGNYIAEFKNTNTTTPYGLFANSPSGAAAGYPIFCVNQQGGSPATKLRIDSSTGKMYINTDSLFASNFHASLYMTDTGGILFKPDGTSTRYPLGFLNSSGTFVGSVTSGTSSTSFNTSSDYRLKENVTAISDGITRLKTLKPSRFNFIADAKTTVDGFLAHEVTAVPEAITGIKDETEDILYTEQDEIPSGKKVGDVKETVPKYQGIDQSKLVPLLTAALQEAIAKIETLETKVAALEAA